MKITFVIPNMSWLYDYKAQFPLGILYVVSALKECGEQVDFYDSNIHSIDEIPEVEVFAFSAVYNTYNSCVNLAKSIRLKYPGRKIIIGGPYPTLLPDSVDRIFDSVFIGEGENIIKEFINDYKKGQVKRVYKETEMIDIDNLYPDRSILPISYIRTKSIFAGDTVYDEHGSTCLMLSRGCPFDCSFCCGPRLWHHKVRFRPVASIIKEIKNIIELYNIRQFRIQDDTFTINRHFVRKLNNELQKLNIYYRCSTRADVIDNDIAKSLYDSGCREVGFGVEVADDIVLKKMHKDSSIAIMSKAIKILKAHSIKVRCFFMMGLPYDSYETIQHNITFIENNDIDHLTVNNLIPFPGSAMYEHMNEYNIRGIKKETCMNIAKHIPLVPNILRTDISEEEHIAIMKVFYDYLIEKGRI